jgi:hypothetical protein
MMKQMQAAATPHEETISCVVIRADGRRENRGVISYRGRNPVKRLLWGLWIASKAHYWIWRERQYLRRNAGAPQ